MTLWDSRRIRLKTRSDRAFASSAPNLWNGLPATIRTSDSVHSFKARFKTYLLNPALPTRSLIAVPLLISLDAHDYNT